MYKQKQLQQMVNIVLKLKIKNYKKEGYINE